ncbi:MAG TPA: hypothetical protein VFQ12_02205 [Thermoleophilaceae bacterium]|nr:hypothetical protein [Thermoleophilaceae bacterium]
MSRPAADFIRRTASGSKSRSIRVLALRTVSSVLEYSAITSLDGYVADAEGNFDWASPSR